MKTYNLKKKQILKRKTHFEKSQGFLNSGSIMDCQLLHQFFRQIFLIFLGNVNINISVKKTYSSVRNRRACTFINFEEKIPPARPYLALHVYCF